MVISHFLPHEIFQKVDRYAYLYIKKLFHGLKKLIFEKSQVKWKFTGFNIKIWFYFLIIFVNLGNLNTACL